MAEATSKTIDGITDLVVVAPIKPGFIEAFENITYESRLKLVAEALHKIRVNAREHELIAPFADTAERILSLFNFRIGVLDPGQFSVKGSAGQDSSTQAPAERFMFLVATFDGPWEPYMRLIWKPLGPFLDLLLCNCEGYKLATRTGFPEYADWVRRHQVEPSIFYSTTKLTVRDHIYLAQLEKLQRELDPATASPPVDQQLAALTMTNPEAKARAVWADLDNARDALRLSFEALSVLYRLADYFPADRILPTQTNGEGGILLKAAQDLLLGLRARIADYIDTGDPALVGPLIAFGIIPDPQNPASQRIRPYFEAWNWFTQAVPSPVIAPKIEPPAAGEIQKGLLTDYDDADWRVTNGLIFLLRITHAKKAAIFLQSLKQSWESDEVSDELPNRLYLNMAFTASGLSRMGMPSGDLSRFPKEFRDGLFERAPHIGDIRANHPRRWKMPKRRLPDNSGDDLQSPRIHSEEIDVVIQYRDAIRATALQKPPQFIDFEALSLNMLADTARNIKSKPQNIPRRSPDDFNFDDADKADFESKFLIENGIDINFLIFLEIMSHLLDNEEETGLQTIGVESTFRPLKEDSKPDASATTQWRNRDHFGFIDGISQPQPSDSPVLPAPNKYDQRVPFGDVLVGYRNSRGDRHGDHHWYPADDKAVDYQTNGSFLVLRKIAQFPERLPALPVGVAEAMIGRTRDGKPLIADDPLSPNGFLYRKDPQQLHCPFSAHIRLANPRDSFHGRPAPRILRRGMSYGERLIPDDEASRAEPRGVLFMAYNASLAEQYEVIQRWLNGGNATDVASAANDPLTGPAREPGPRTFRYRKPDGSVARTTIAEPLSELRWGMYAFAPSKSALAKILALPTMPTPNDDGTLAQGDAIIQRLLALPKCQQRTEWKRLLEDFSSKDVSELDEARRVWKAIREIHGGVLHLPEGLPFGGGASQESEDVAAEQPVVLVATKDAIEEVLSRPKRFSVSEQGRRTERTFGAIYVAMDPGLRYHRESRATNSIVHKYSTTQSTQDQVFVKARELATKQLGEAKKLATVVGQDFFKIELRRDFLVPVLADLCTWLFDIPDFDQRNPSKPYYFDRAPWGWQLVDPDGDTTAAEGMRKPRCPADFMAPSRTCFYPRPTGAIQAYGENHGKGLHAASQHFVAFRTAPGGGGLKGVLSAPMADAIKAPELLARNIIGLMEGMLPPLDGLMRGIMFDWIETDTMWRNQSSYVAAARANGTVTRTTVENALSEAVKTAMCRRPAPDLIYRTATKDTTIAGQDVAEGTLVVLGLASPMMESLDDRSPDISPVFGGYRKAAWQKEGDPPHACPAYGMVMAMIYGMIAALFDAGRIVVQPASLILRFDEWAGPGPGER